MHNPTQIEPSPAELRKLEKSRRPFWKKKRVIIPGLALGFVLLGTALSGGDDTTTTTPPGGRTQTQVPVEQPEQQVQDNRTVAQIQATAAAANYLAFQAFSREGLIKQLEFEGFNTADATYGVDAQGADWNRQAELKAQQYLDTGMAFSKSKLIDQLEYEGFTHAEAVHGAESVGL